MSFRRPLGAWNDKKPAEAGFLLGVCRKKGSQADR